MSILDLKYGDASFPITIDGLHTSLVTSQETIGETDEQAILRTSLANPIDSPRLQDLLSAHDSVAVIIPDITRSWQKPSVYLPVLIEEIKRAGLSDGQIHFICALGTHRKQTRKEHRELLGEDLYRRFDIVDHDGKDDANLTYVGITRLGTEVFINAQALNYDHIVLTGGIVFHDLAGFGGGRKVLVPGIAGYKTVMQNHALSLNPQGEGIHPLVSSNRLAGNPFHEDLMEAAALVNPTFLFNVLISDQGKIMHAVAGNYITAHQAGCDYLRSVDVCAIDEQADVVVASCGGYPKDIDFYQATKALCNAFHACKTGGDILLLAQCREGLGHPEMASMFKDFATNSERQAHVRAHYTIAKFFAYLTCVWAQDFHIHLVSTLDKSVMQAIGITVHDTLDEALGEVKKRHAGVYKTIVMPSAASTLPQRQGENP